MKIEMSDKTTNVLKNIKSAVSAGNSELDAQGLIAAFENAELTPEDDFPLKELTQTSLGMVSFSNDLGAAYLTGGYSSSQNYYTGSNVPDSFKYTLYAGALFTFATASFSVSKAVKEYQESKKTGEDVNISTWTQLTDALASSLDAAVALTEFGLNNGLMSSSSVLARTMAVTLLPIAPVFVVVSVAATVASLYFSAKEAEQDRVKLRGLLERMSGYLRTIPLDQRREAVEKYVQTLEDPNANLFKKSVSNVYLAVLDSISDRELAFMAQRNVEVQKALMHGYVLPRNLTISTSPIVSPDYLNRDDSFWLSRAQLYRQYFLNDKSSPWISKDWAGRSDVIGYQEGYFGPEYEENFNIRVDPLDGGSFFDENSPQYLFAKGSLSLDGGNVSDLIFGDQYDNIMSGDEGNDNLKGYEGNDLLSGNEGDDYIFGGTQDDIITGNEGVDSLYGGEGNDLLGLTDLLKESFSELDGKSGNYYGGSGNDTLGGSSGKDTYYFRRGDGNDVIYTRGGPDILIIGKYDTIDDFNYRSQSVLSTDLVFSKKGFDLLITIKPESSDRLQDTILIKDWFNPQNPQQLAEIRIGEEVITADEITTKILTQVGTPESDTLTGISGFSNTLIGLEGDDVLTGTNTPGSDKKGDTYNGGKGNDQISGTNLNDTYIYEIGDGNDTIIENSGMGDSILLGYSAAQTVFYRVGNNLTAAMDSRYNSIIVSGWFESDAKKIESWTFGAKSDNTSDGSLQKDTIESIAGLGVVGTDNNDILEATSNIQKTNVFVGGAGNDIITTSIGSNTILFSKQDGNDVVNLRGETFITTGAGLGQNFNVFAKNDGAIEVVWSTGESLLLRNIDGLNVSFKTTLMVEDGFIYTGTDLINKIVNVSNESSNFLHANSSSPDLIGYGGSDELWGDARSQDLNGGAGADIIYGNGGDDRFFGEGGDDLIYATSNGNGSTFFFSQQADNDTIYINNSNTNKIDTLRVVRGENFDISPVKSDLVFVKKDAGQGDLGYFDAIISIKGRQDSVTIKNFFNPSGTNQCAIDRIVFDDGTVMNYAEICDKLNSYVDPNIIKGTPGVDSLRGNGIATKIYGLAGNDTIVGSAIAEWIDAGDNDDAIAAGSFDVVIGGLGSDTIASDGANIVFKVGGGSGADSINLTNSNNNYIDWARVLKSDIVVKIVGNDLLVSAKGDSVTLKGYFNQNILNTTKHISAIRFDDGSIMNNAELLQSASYASNTAYGTGNNDTIYANPGVTRVYGGGGNDTIGGGELDDTLSGDEGDDTLRGNGGNDILYGGAGNDILDGGKGYDKLYGGEGNDVLGGNVGGMDSGYYNLSYTPYGYIDPLSGNYYEGGGGNDILNGTSRADVYYFNLGDGKDTIYEVEVGGQPANQIDLIKLGAGINPSDLLIYRINTNLVLANKNNSDSITISGWFSGQGSSAYQVEMVEFSDGTRWSATQLTDWGLNIPGTSFNDTLNGVSNYENNLSGGAGNDTLGGGDRNDILNGDDGDDILRGNAGNDLLYGGAGADKLEGGTGNDVLYGGEGNDTLDGAQGYDMFYGGAGNDVLGGPANSNDSGYYNLSYTPYSYIDPLSGNYYEGGTGNDILNGTSRADVYYFNLGDGKDTIYEVEVGGQPANQVDIIKLGTGINPGDIIVSRTNNNLILTNKTNADSITIAGWFSSQGSVSYQVEAVEFSDGTRWSASQLTEWGLNPVGTASNDILNGHANYENNLSGGAGNDTIGGGERNDILNGDEGDDTLRGNAGNDLLYGGAGVDKLEGGTGNDVLYGGEGNDTLDGAQGYDMFYGGEGNDVLGGPANSNDAGYYNLSYTPYSYIDPLSGNYYEGGAGNDILNGTSRADVYYFNLGDGKDTIYEVEVGGQPANQVDVIKLGVGINPSDLLISRLNSNLVITNKTNADSITIAGWFSSQGSVSYQVEAVEFSDGTRWSASQLTEWGLSVAGTVSGDVLNGLTYYMNTISGAGGNDTLNGGSLNDVLYGDEGDDILRGNIGNDMLYGGVGNDNLDGGQGYDMLYGGEGNDILGGVLNSTDSGYYYTLSSPYSYMDPLSGNYYEGGIGNDVLNGTSRADVYFFNFGDGKDTIYEAEVTGQPSNQVDIIKLGVGINPEDLLVTKDSTSMVITNKTSGDSITIRSWYSSTSGNAYKIERVEFATGVSWNIADLESKAQQNVVVNALKFSSMPSTDSAISTAPQLNPALSTNLSLIISEAKQDFAMQIGGTGTLISQDYLSSQPTQLFTVTDGVLNPEELNKKIAPAKVFAE